MQPDSDSGEALIEEIEAVGLQIGRVRDMIGKVIFGQTEVVDETLITLLAGGHALLIGVPGLAKTKLAETLGTVLGLEDKRVQFTPDLMPADILGSEVLEESEDGRRSFRFIKGPVFCQVLMADEINRASPRTQSALLQAMQEHAVTIAGERYPLPAPFHVLATQNPLEQEGTYPLPEAQLDRFLLQIDVGYPDLDSERRMLHATTGAEEFKPDPVITAEQLQAAQTLVRRIPVGDAVVDAILQLVRDGRPETSHIAEVKRHVAWGPGPRASQALMLAVRARALMDGRLSPSIDDVIALAGPVLRHRMALSFSARADGLSLDGPSSTCSPRRTADRTPMSESRHAHHETLRHGAERAASTLPALLVAAEQVAATVMQGVHGRRKIGDGESFWQFRQFEFGDPITRIDWRRSARGENMFIRENELESAQSVWLWRDGSQSMNYASNRDLATKRDRAELLLTALAILLVRGGERVGLYGLDTVTRSSRASITRLVMTLSGDSAAAADETPSLPVAGPLRRHSHLVLFSDFLSPLTEVETTVRAFAAQGVRGHLLQVLDPAEEDLPFRGRTRFLGFENDGDMTVGRVESLRDAYIRRMTTRQGALTDLTRSVGWTWTYHRSDRSAQAALLNLYQALSLQERI